MTKSELINRLVTKKVIPSHHARGIVDDIIDEIKTALIKGENVQLLGFGTFSVHTRQPRNGTNPRTGEEIQLPESKHVHFATHKSFKEALNK